MLVAFRPTPFLWSPTIHQLPVRLKFYGLVKKVQFIVDGEIRVTLTNELVYFLFSFGNIIIFVGIYFVVMG